MKKIMLITLLVAWGILSSAQGIFNDGAYIVSQTGSYWVIDNGDFTLTSLSSVNLAQVAHLTIMDDASLTMTPTSYLTVTGTLANHSGEDGLVLDGSTTSTASLKQTSANVSATVKREIASWSTNHGWHFLSSPVSSQAISPEFVDVIANPMSALVDFYRWSEPLDLWVNIKNLSSTYNKGSGEIYFSNDDSPAFVNGKGYLVAFQSTVTKNFTGTLNYESVSVTGLSKTDATGYSGWNLVGNPFSCAIQWGLGTWNLNNVDENIQIWNEASASYTIVSDGNDIIPALNGFMVHASVNGASLTIPTASRVHDNTSWYKGELVYENGVVLKAVDPEGSTAQESIIRFNPEATSGYDTRYDSYFLSGYAPQFYSVSNAENYALNTLPEQAENLVIPMGFVKNGSTHFSIELEENGMGVGVYLYDRITGLTHKLNDGAYAFSSDEQDTHERFEIRFSPVGVDEVVSIPQPKVWYANNKLYVAGGAPNTQLAVYDLQGRLMVTWKLNAGDNNFILNLPAGIYLARINQQTIKIVITN